MGIWAQLKHINLYNRIFYIFGIHILQYILWLFSWWAVGNGMLQGRVGYGWLIIWTILLLIMVAFRLLTTWYQGMFSIGLGAMLKQKLLYGAMRIDPEKIRHQGIGQLLGSVIESETVELLAMTGGFLSIVSSIELIIATFVLSTGAGGWLHLLLFICWMMITFLIGWRYFRHRRQWTETRLEMTNDLVERMEGHRTRLAQQIPERWHDGEDSLVHQYLSKSEAMDQSAAFISLSI